MIFNLDQAKKLIDAKTTLFWFRRDLRLADNAGLYRALKETTNVLPIFIFDIVILDQLENKMDRRVEFIQQSLRLIKEELENEGSSLLIFHGDPIEIFKQLKPHAVYTNHDYEPYAGKRDEQVRNILEKNGAVFKTYKDQVIFEKDEVLKDDGQALHHLHALQQ